MRAISVRAPWWWAILYLGKRVENRDRAWHFRGPLYLHASKYWSRFQVEWDWEVIWTKILLQPVPPLPPAMRAAGGCLVGRMTIADCVTASDSPWFFGPHGLVLSEIAPLMAPVPFKGALGLFDVPASVPIQSLETRQTLVPEIFS